MQEKKNLSIGKIGLSLFIGYFIIIFCEMILTILQILPHLNISTIDFLFPIVFWAKFAFAFFGMLLFMISLVISKRKIKDLEYSRTLKIPRIISIALSILIPLSVFYYILAGVSAWGDTVVGAYLFTIGNIVTQGLLLLPLFIWYFQVHKYHIHEKSKLIKKGSIITNLIVLGLFIVIYLISSYVYFEFYEAISGYDIAFVSIVFGMQFIYGIVTCVLLVNVIRNYSKIINPR